MIQYDYFTDEELDCHCNYPDCDGGIMKPSFMDRLIALREYLDFPFPVSSGFRCERHNEDVGGENGSYHLKGEGVDIQVGYDRACLIVENARKFGFKGIGVSQKGNKRFIHLDTRDQKDVSFWSY